MANLGLLIVLLTVTSTLMDAPAVASAPWVDTPAMAAANRPVSVLLEAAAPEAGTGITHQACAPTPTPTLPKNFIWWSFLFTAIGLLRHALPWIVFWMTSDWTVIQYDAFTEWTIFIDMLGSLFTLVLHLFFLSELNVDTVIAEFVAILFDLQQIFQIMEKRANVNQHYTNGKLYDYGRNMLLYCFWGCFGLLIAVFYQLQHFVPTDQNRTSKIFTVAFSVAAHFLQVIAILFPFIHRWRANAWTDESAVFYVAKVVSALMQIISSGFDWWNYQSYSYYWTSGFLGNQNALSLAITSTCCGILLLFARAVGYAKFKIILVYFARDSAVGTVHTIVIDMTQLATLGQDYELQRQVQEKDDELQRKYDELQRKDNDIQEPKDKMVALQEAIKNVQPEKQLLNMARLAMLGQDYELQRQVQEKDDELQRKDDELQRKDNDIQELKDKMVALQEAIKNVQPEKQLLSKPLPASEESLACVESLASEPHPPYDSNAEESLDSDHDGDQSEE